MVKKQRTMEEGEEGGDDRDGHREGCQIDREKKRNEVTVVMDATAAVGSVELCPFTYQSAFCRVIHLRDGVKLWRE